MAKVVIDGDDELREIIRATNKEKPAQADIERLETYLTKHPQTMQALGNLANQVMTVVIDNAFSSATTSVSVASFTASMRIDLGYKQATVIERGLIDHVILCWLRLYVAEFHYEQFSKNASLDRALFWEKALTQNQKRYLRAVETLARVRRLMKDPPNPAFNLLLKQQVLNISK